MSLPLEGLIGMIRKGEGSTIEFKRSPRGIAETVCSFSNTEGGVLLVGVDDDGAIVGTAHDAVQRISDLLQGVSPPPRVIISSLAVGEKEVVVVEVGRSSHLHSVRNVVYVRIGRNNRPLSIEEVVTRAVESLKISFDTLPAQAPLGSIDASLVEQYLERRREVRGIVPMGSYEENLKRLRIAVEGEGTLVPTNAGLLFFSDEPQRYLPWSSVRLIVFEDARGEVERDSKEFTGPVWRIVDEIEGHLLRDLRVLGIRTGFKREDVLEYPMEALREALINAIVHRNYYDRSDVRMFMFPDRFVIRNPGSFPPGITVEHPEHAPRNELLCRFMYDFGYIERYGFGIERIKEGCRRHPAVEVEFNLRPFRTEVVFRKAGDLAPLMDTDAKIVALVRVGPRTSSEVAASLGVSKVTAVRRLNRLVSLGIMARTGKGRGTRYSSIES